MLALALVLAAAPAQTAFHRLAAMSGDWVATEGGKESPARFDVEAKGTVVVQKSGYVAVFQLDADALLATVFVDDGFSVRLRAEGKGLGGDTVLLEVVEVTNKAAAKNGLPERLELKWSGADHAVQKWTWRPPKGDPFTFEVALARKPR